LWGKTEKNVGTFGLSKCPAKEWRKNTMVKVLSHYAKENQRRSF
jgi:hypothetical protein